MADFNKHFSSSSEAPAVTGDEEGTPKMVAIFVLVAGVIGGLAAVISFVVFCKTCFGRRKPLTTTASPHEKRTKNLDTAFKTMALAIPDPVPVNLQNYLQQPTLNNNSELTPDFAAVANGGRSGRRKNLEHQTTKDSDDLQLVVQAEVVMSATMSNAPEIYIADDDTDTMFQQKSRTATDMTKPMRDRAHSGVMMDEICEIPPVRRELNEHSVLLSPQDSEIRSSTFNEQFVRRGTGRKLPQPEEDTRYYGKFGGNYATFDIPGSPNRASIPQKQKTVAEIRPQVRPPLRKQVASLNPPEFMGDSPGGRTSPRVPFAHLPRSHQVVIEKSSPPLHRQSRSSPLPDNEFSSSDSFSHPPLTAPPFPGSNADRFYHREAYSFAEPEIQVSRTGKPVYMYPREHRFAYSCTETLPPPRNEAEIENFRDFRSTNQVPSTTGVRAGANTFEFDSLSKFFRQVQDVFTTEPDTENMGRYTSGSSSGSSGGQLFITSEADPMVTTASSRQIPAPNRQAKSFEDAKFGPTLRAPLNNERQSRSFDGACSACRNDALQRLALIREDSLAKHLQLKQFYESAQLPALRRQRPLDETIETFASEVAQAEERARYHEALKAQCHQLWSLRQTLEETTEEGDEDEEDLPEEEEESGKRMKLPETSGHHIHISEMDAVDAVSYTTSFESNTEPTGEEYGNVLPAAGPSGAYLQPPKLSSEAKRQKYKNLFARRQWELQQKLMTGNSLENSFDSVDTYSSGSSRQDANFLTSIESNTGEQTDSTVDSQGRKKGFAEQKNDSGYKSQSTEAQTQTSVHGVPGLDKITQMPSIESEFIHAIEDTSTSEGTVTAIFTGALYPQNASGKYADLDTDSRSGISGESFDGGGAVSPTNESAAALAALPPNGNLARLQRNGVQSTKFAAPSRDFSIDSHTDAVFREFTAFDPRLEQVAVSTLTGTNGTNGGRLKNGKFNGENGRCMSPRSKRVSKMSPGDSIEEESGTFGPAGAPPPPPAPAPVPVTIQTAIPLILLPDEQEISSG